MKASEVIDHLATVCWSSLGQREARHHFGSEGAALKLWRFMRPEEPGRLTSAQHHAATRLLVWAEGALSSTSQLAPEAEKDLALAIRRAVHTLKIEPPASVRAGSAHARRTMKQATTARQTTAPVSK